MATPEDGDLAVGGGESGELDNVWTKGHCLPAVMQPLRPGDVSFEGAVDALEVFLPGGRVAFFCCPFARVVPPPSPKLLEVVSGDLAQAIHSATPLIVVEDIVHIEQKEHQSKPRAPQ